MRLPPGKLDGPAVIPVKARWQLPSGRPMWGDYEYALVVEMPGRVVVFEVRESEE